MLSYSDLLNSQEADQLLSKLFQLSFFNIFFSKSLLIPYIHLCIHFRGQYESWWIRKAITIYSIALAYSIGAWWTFAFVLLLEGLRYAFIYLVPYYLLSLKIRGTPRNRAFIKKVIKTLSVLDKVEALGPLLMEFLPISSQETVGPYTAVGRHPAEVDMTAEEWDRLFGPIHFFKNIIFNPYVIVKFPKVYMADQYIIREHPETIAVNCCGICKEPLLITLQLKCGKEVCPGCALGRNAANPH